jgi:ElaA protein
MISWQLFNFKQLSPELLYQVLKLRVDVFVVEQNCPYPELDNKDLADGVYQLIGYQGSEFEDGEIEDGEIGNGEIVACARLLPAGISFEHVSIGRVATKASARGAGLGHQLMETALFHCQQLWPDQSIEIGAQAHLKPFYQAHGFKQVSEIYLEDGIPHIDMRLMK